MSVPEDDGILDAIGGDTPSSVAAQYEPMRVVLAGASFESINGSMPDRPHTHEHLQVLMVPKGHVLKYIGFPGATVADFVTAIEDLEPAIINEGNGEDFRIDAGILGLAGVQIQDSYAPPYTTLAEVGQAIEAFQVYARNVYAIRPPRTVGVDWCFIRQDRSGNPQPFTDLNWDIYIAAWDEYMALNYPEVGIIDAYDGFTDSKAYAPGYVDFGGDWHLSTRSAAIAAARIWRRLEQDVTPEKYTPEDWAPTPGCP